MLELTQQVMQMLEQLVDGTFGRFGICAQDRRQDCDCFERDKSVLRSRVSDSREQRVRKKEGS